jgi:hypothetical protein
VAAWPEISQRRTEGGNVKAVLVQPVAVQEKNPIFRVRLWAPPAKGGYAWLVDDWELTEATVDDVPASVTRQSGRTASTVGADIQIQTGRVSTLDTKGKAPFGINC